MIELVILLSVIANIAVYTVGNARLFPTDWVIGLVLLQCAGSYIGYLIWYVWLDIPWLFILSLWVNAIYMAYLISTDRYPC